MAKNILEYQVAKKINKNIKEAKILKDEVIRALKEKNGKKHEEWKTKAVEQRK